MIVDAYTMILKRLIAIILLSFQLVFASNNPQALCGYFYEKTSLGKSSIAIQKWKALTLKEKEEYRRNHMLARDNSASRTERRPKRLTTGSRNDADKNMDMADVRIDTADPSLVMPITYPDGKTKFRINFSGQRFIEVDDANMFYKGGVFKVHRSRGFYKDGTEMVGPYHNASWPWDVVIYKNDAGENIALGGSMVQVKPGQLPNVAEHNFTRSRWWGEVKHSEIAPGKFEERIIWQGPIHDFNTAPHKDWVYHGYGGTLLTKFNSKTKIHEPIKNARGNYSLFYERVTEQKVGPDGRPYPWVTTLFMRDMDPSMKFTVGPEHLVTSITSPTTNKYFEATRRGTPSNPEGYLAEGGNVLIESKRDILLKVWSGNDYVRKYGIYLDYQPAAKGGDSTFTPVIDKNGELIDFATTLNLRKLLNATWLGRPQMEYDPGGNLWLRFHFVDIKTIPDGGPVEGWPSAEQFPNYARTSAQVPIKIIYDNAGIPKIELDIDPEYRHIYELE